MRVLAVRAGALGDVLLLRRAVFALRLSGHEVVLAAPEAAGRVLVGGGRSEVASLVPWERAAWARLLAGDGAAGPAECAGCAAALVFSRSGTLRDALAAVIPRVHLHDPAPPPGWHAAAWLAQACGALAVPIPAAPPPPLRPSHEDTQTARPLLDRLPARFLAVHPGSGSPAKNWPRGRFGELVAARAAGAPFLLVVGPADTAAAAPLATRREAVIARDLPPRVLGAMLAAAGVYVGNDSGVTHLAAAYGAPTVALFGPTDPAQWSPVGPQVTVLRAPSGDLTALEVVRVGEAIERALATSSPAVPPHAPSFGVS